MPTTINGIGTWYYGKSDLTTRPAACPHCNRDTMLESYNTTLFFVVLFIPLVPMGRKRIIDKCPACTQHAVADLTSYTAAKKDDIDAAVKAYCEDPDDEEKACRAVGMTVQYRDPAAFGAVAALVRENLPGSVQVHGLVASAHQFFGQAAEAEAAFKQSLAMAFDAELAQEYAIKLLREGRTAEARQQLDHLWAAPSREGVDYLFAYVETCQMLGQHDDALAALDHWEPQVPGLAQASESIRYRRRSQKHRHTGKKLKPLAAEWTPGMKIGVPVLLAIIIGLVLFITFVLMHD